MTAQTTFPDRMRMTNAHVARLAHDQLKRFTYKKGWTFTLRMDFIYGPVLVIEFECEDTYNPGNMIKVCGGAPLMAGLVEDAEAFASWLAHEIQRIEIHESREWLKRDGVIFDNPHA